jgi:serine protease Do
MNLKRTLGNLGITATLVITYSILALGILGAAGFDNDNSASSPVENAAYDEAQSTPPLGTTPSSFVGLADKLAPTVVNVKVTKVAKTEMAIPQMPGDPFGEFFERYFGGIPRGQEPRQAQGAGSGVIIDAEGYILTNNHVVEGATEVTVTTSEGTEYDAEVVRTDLAVLRIKNPGNLPVAVLGDSEKLQVGEWVLAIGNPFGLSHTVTSGIVSAKSRVIGAGPYDDFIQTDASINPGNSGGPLFNMQGEVVGINTAIIPQGQGIGFAIPVDTAKPLIPQLVSDGRVTRGYLGVTIQPVTKNLAKAMGLEDAGGALVSEVVPGGPADEGGLRQGDVITEFAGRTVKDNHSLPAIVASTPVGEEVTVKVQRDGSEHQIEVEVGVLEADVPRAGGQGESENAKWGLMLRDLTPALAKQLGLDIDKGALVAGVQPGTPASQAGLQRGDVILEINRTSVSSAVEAKSILKKNGGDDSLLLLVQRGEQSLFIALVAED